jgi:hypothetical protein
MGDVALNRTLDGILDMQLLSAGAFTAVNPSMDEPEETYLRDPWIWNRVVVIAT